MNVNPIQLIFSIAILIMSVVIHEVSHGFVAYMQGDSTAKYQNRLTLNPLRHLDIFGSIIVPFITFIYGGFIWGWAKPVPYNPYNFKNQRWGELFVALAGPFSNILIAIVFAIITRIALISQLPASFIGLASLVVLVNLSLAIFNLIPIPPLDGSKIIFFFIPYRYNHIRQWIERYAIILIFFVVLFASPILAPIVRFLFFYFTGLPINY